MVKRYFGTCVINVRGLNFERLLNACIKENIELNLIDKSGDKILIECPYIFYKKVLQLLKSYQIIGTEFRGLCNAFNFIKKRFMIIVGLVVALFIGVLWQTHLWHYSISGLERVEKSEIEKFLNESGYGIGVSLSGINTNNLSNALLDNFKQLSFVSVMRVGTSLVLNFKEKEYDENLDESLMLPLVASFDGVVSKIVVNQGTAVVRAGDVVKKGQVLIAPYVFVNGKQKKVRAKGECTAQVFVKGQVVFNENETKEVRSGKFITLRKMQFFNHTFNCLNEKVPYEKYEVEKNAKIICKNMPICFKIVNIKCYEIIKVKEQKMFEEEKPILIKQSRYLAYKNLKANFNVENEQTDIVVAGQNYYITTYVKIITDIGEYENNSKVGNSNKS